MSGRRTLQVVAMLGGLIAWAAQFTVLYGVTSTACGRGWADTTLFGIGIVHITVVLATLSALGATAIVLVASLEAYKRSTGPSLSVVDHFINRATVLISSFSLVVIVWHAVPAFILPACA
jgi:hypothetical protein